MPGGKVVPTTRSMDIRGEGERASVAVGTVLHESASHRISYTAD
jgi:hypothetical protein